MRYVYAALLALACLTPWALYLDHLRRCRRDRTATRTQLALARGGLAGRPRPLRVGPNLGSLTPEELARFKERFERERYGRWIEPAAVRPYVLDVPDDVIDEPHAPGWLTVQQAAAVGQHPFEAAFEAIWPHDSPWCTRPGCGAVSGDPIHFTPTGPLQGPQDATEPPAPAPEDPRPGSEPPTGRTGPPVYGRDFLDLPPDGWISCLSCGRTLRVREHDRAECARIARTRRTGDRKQPGPDAYPYA